MKPDSLLGELMRRDRATAVGSGRFDGSKPALYAPSPLTGEGRDGGENSYRARSWVWLTLLGDKGSTIIMFTLVLGAAIVLKYHYSIAGSDDLAWILAPLARTVEVFSDLSFHSESGAGYVSDDGLIIIAPVCAGINFLIALLLTGASLALSAPGGFGRKVLRLAMLVISCYLVAIMVNGLRIVLAVELYTLNIHGGWFTEQRVHRAVGILLYFPALLAYGLVVQRLLANRSSRLLIGSCLLWYLGPCLGVPFLTGSFQEFGFRFYEHCLTIVVGCALSIAGYCLLIHHWRRKRGDCPPKPAPTFLLP